MQKEQTNNDSTPSRRELRLRTLFEPYRFLQLRLSDQLHAPIVLTPASNTKLRPYTVSIFRRLLSENSPDWIEYAILSHARNVASFFERHIKLPDPSNLTTESSAQLLKYYQDVKQKTSIEIAISGSLTSTWVALQEQYFPERLDLRSYRLRWSNRGQRSCLASCNVEKLTVNVAKLFEDPAYHQFISPLLYHEMCHAVLGKPTEKNGRRVLHGKEFRSLERQNPDIIMLDAWIKSGGWHQAVRRLHAKNRRALRAQR